MTILSFLREFISDDLEGYQLQAIKEAVTEFENEIYKKMTNEQMDECDKENAINQLIGKSPTKEDL